MDLTLLADELYDAFEEAMTQYVDSGGNPVWREIAADLNVARKLVLRASKRQV